MTMIKVTNNRAQKAADLQRKLIKLSEQITNIEHSGLEGAAHHYTKIIDAYMWKGPQGVREYCAPYMKKQDGRK
jgi:hypothetical protein